jgi:hypothetical protein
VEHHEHIRADRARVAALVKRYSVRASCARQVERGSADLARPVYFWITDSGS